MVELHRSDGVVWYKDKPEEKSEVNGEKFI